MNGIVTYKYFMRQNLLGFLSVCLCFYFCYHLVTGDRSIVRLLLLEKKIERVAQQYESHALDRQAIEARVVMLRPGSIDPDLLEERVRHVLGYVRPGERIVQE
jgi:cell division protein FtsB